LREVENTLNELHVNTAVVTFEAGALAQAYIRDTNLKWPLLVDEDRTLYTAYGMEHGTLWNIYGPPAWWIYAKLLAKGRKLKTSRSDFQQLGGDILIDPDGTVQIHHVGIGPADRPTVESILNRVKASTA
jgi:hypothetical protein